MKYYAIKDPQSEKGELLTTVVETGLRNKIFYNYANLYLEEVTADKRDEYMGSDIRPILYVAYKQECPEDEDGYAGKLVPVYYPDELANIDKQHQPIRDAAEVTLSQIDQFLSRYDDNYFSWKHFIGCLKNTFMIMKSTAEHFKHKPIGPHNPLGLNDDNLRTITLRSLLKLQSYLASYKSTDAPRTAEESILEESLRQELTDLIRNIQDQFGAAVESGDTASETERRDETISIRKDMPRNPAQTPLTAENLKRLEEEFPLMPGKEPEKERITSWKVTMTANPVVPACNGGLRSPCIPISHLTFFSQKQVPDETDPKTVPARPLSQIWH